MKHRLIPFIILSFAVLFLGLATGNNIYYLIFNTMVFVFLLSLTTLIYSYLQFKYRQILSPKFGMKGQSIDLEMQVHNDHMLPISYIELEYDLPNDFLTLDTNVASFGVMHKSKVSVNKKIICKYRGKWKVGIKKATLYYVFGLLKITLNFYKNDNYRTLNLVIKPRVVPLTDLPLPYRETSSNQNQISKATQDTAEISDIRKYVQGDILKKIHWKLSAAKRQLLVKNHSLSYVPDTLIYLDCSKHNLVGSEAIILEDMIIECCTAVVNYLLNAYLPMKLIAVDMQKTILSGNNPKAFGMMYDFLSEIEFKSAFKLFDLLSGEINSISNVSSIFIITHFIDFSGFDNLIYLREANVDITIILVSKEKITSNKKYQNMISALIEVGVNIIKIAPDDDLNLKIKEHRNEI